jgi:UDP-N-acetylglucosamine transferase subunit ALG13
VIFVTVGTQLPFHRLIGAMDAWAGANPQAEVFAQVGPTTQPPRHMPFAAFLSPQEADERLRSATLIVAHAGMGTVLTALEAGRPLIIVPRRASLGEHRNEHQLATARWLVARPGIGVAMDESELPRLLSCPPDRGSLPPHASGPLVERLAAEIASAARRGR